MSAADIIRKIIRDNLKARFENITIANGYYTDIGKNVTIKKTNPYGANKLDGIDIIDEREEQTIDSEDHSLSLRTLRVKLALALKQADPDKVLEVIADIEKAILIDTTWGHYADYTLPEGNEDDVDQNENIVRGVNIYIAIVYRTKLFNAEQ